MTLVSTSVKYQSHRIFDRLDEYRGSGRSVIVYLQESSQHCHHVGRSGFHPRVNVGHHHEAVRLLRLEALLVSAVRSRLRGRQKPVLGAR